MIPALNSNVLMSYCVGQISDIQVIFEELSGNNNLRGNMKDWHTLFLCSTRVNDIYYNG